MLEAVDRRQFGCRSRCIRQPSMAGRRFRSRVEECAVALAGQLQKADQDEPRAPSDDHQHGRSAHSPGLRIARVGPPRRSEKRAPLQAFPFDMVIQCSWRRHNSAVGRRAINERGDKVHPNEAQLEGDDARAAAQTIRCNDSG